MNSYQVTIDSQTFNVQILSDPMQDTVDVEVNGQQRTVQVNTVPVPPDAQSEPTATLDADVVQKPAIATMHQAGTPMTGSNSVLAPLPGVIKSVAVSAGQSVQTGDILLVIEAMKMDNVIRAPKGGSIGVVHVSSGDRVTHGDVMVDYQD